MILPNQIRYEELYFDPKVEASAWDSYYIVGPRNGRDDLIYLGRIMIAAKENKIAVKYVTPADGFEADERQT